MKFSLATLAAVLLASNTVSALQFGSQAPAAIQQRDEELAARGDFLTVPETVHKPSPHKGKNHKREEEDDDEDDEEDDEDEEEEDEEERPLSRREVNELFRRMGGNGNCSKHGHGMVCKKNHGGRPPKMTVCGKCRPTAASGEGCLCDA